MKKIDSPVFPLRSLRPLRENVFLRELGEVPAPLFPPTFYPQKTTRLRSRVVE